ncbi:DUF3137 domain-containing protein [Spiroplasma endosymbiont of Labia minor]|uniref:DUF3137 domain-containing protein n=1 Tax=Spiroplasma endosymbiont of Labia minor TaxID=3066305 RepID=UPI0030D256A5
MDKKWKEEVKLQLDNVLSKYSKKSLNFVSLSKQWNIQITIYIIVAIIFIALAFEVFAQIMGIAGVILGLVIFFVFIITAIVMTSITIKTKKIKKKILTEINVNDIYKNAFEEESDNKIIVTSISKNFDVPILSLLPTVGKNYNDIIINMEIRGIKYSLGSVTNCVTTTYVDSKGRTITRTTFTRYPFLTIELNESLNIETTIKSLKKPFLGIFKHKDNTELESMDFEKMYFVNANDQIAIRKLLTPKIMADLIDEGSKRPIPKLFIKNNFLTFSFPEYIVDSLKAPNGIFTVLNFTNKIDKMFDEICDKILGDFQTFKNYKRWFNIYQIET